MTAAFDCLRTAPASAAGGICEPQRIPGRLPVDDRCSNALLNFWARRPGSHPRQMRRRKRFPLFLAACLMLAASAFCDEPNWSIGGYAGQYYDTEPAGLIKGKANFENQYIAALTASRTVWRANALPLSLEIDGMIGQQFGRASLSEIAIAPVLRWSGFPWNETLRTSVRFGPLGISHTTAVSPLERSASGEGSRTLNFLLIEATFSLPQVKSK